MKADSPIKGSTWHAKDAGDPEQTCAWNPDYADARNLWTHAVMGRWTDIHLELPAHGSGLLRLRHTAAQ